MIASCPVPVYALVFGGDGGPAAGFVHPLTGPDHLLAMYAVGVLSAQVGGRAIWGVPSAFVAAMIAGGLHGIDEGLELEPAFEGNAYTADKPRVPKTLQDARDLFAGSDVAREAFGEEVVDHYLNRARVELDAFEAAVTDWERFRGFERL